MRKTARVLAAGVVGMVGFFAFAHAQPQGEKAPVPKSFGDLVASLKSSPGCLGVELAFTASGKQVIFSWFEDKKAVVKWYYSDAHQKLMKEFFPGDDFRRPLQKVKDGTGPIMIIASVKFAPKAQFKETTLPVSQLALELYTPLDAGGYLGESFAPKGVKIPPLDESRPKKE